MLVKSLEIRKIIPVKDQLPLKRKCYRVQLLGVQKQLPLHKITDWVSMNLSKRVNSSTMDWWN